VVVSVVHVSKGPMAGPFLLDRRLVEIITAYLFHAGGHEDPGRLKANEGKSFQGSIVLGMGFTFDDTDTKAVATPVAEIERLIAKDPHNRERIFPYIGGEEVNDSPTHAHHRYVINFEDFPLRRADLGESWAYASQEQRKEWLRDGVVPLDYPDPVAADWPDLLDIVERKVKPDRLTDNRENYRRYWWQYAERRPGMARALAGKARFLSNPLYSPHLSFVFLPPSIVIANKLSAIPFESYAAFAVLQSRPHEVWARLFSATLKDDLAYAPTDCFETFPFPLGFDSTARLERCGQEYYEARGRIMRNNEKGLTTIYNWFHDPNCACPDIPGLRELHDAMDRAVLDSYGWTDIHPRCQFIPEFEDEEQEDEDGRPQRKRFRYRWPDEDRDEVLARLLALNRERAHAEGQTLDASPEPPADSDGKKRGRVADKHRSLSLLPQGKKEA
jgi:hypothetical protein